MITDNSVDDNKYQFTQDTGSHSFVSSGVLHTMPNNMYNAYIDFVKERVETPLVNFNETGDVINCFASLDENAREAIQQSDSVLQEMYMGDTADTAGQYVDEFMEYYKLSTEQTEEAYKENGKKIMDKKYYELAKEYDIDVSGIGGNVPRGKVISVQGEHSYDSQGNPVVTSYTKQPFTITNAWTQGVFGNKGVAFAEFLHENEKFIATATATDKRFTDNEVVGLGVIMGERGYPKYQKILKDSIGNPEKLSEAMGIIQLDYFKTLPRQTTEWLGMDFETLRGHPDLNKAFFAVADSTWHGGPYCGNYFMALRKVKEEGLDSALNYLRKTKTYYQAGANSARRRYQEDGLVEFSEFLKNNDIDLPVLGPKRAARWGSDKTGAIFMADYNAGKIKG